MKKNEQIFSSYYKLYCPVLNYDWGNTKTNSIIKKFNNEAKEPPFAELWMGAHSKAPSIIEFQNKKIPLDEFIKDNQEHILGTDMFKGGVTKLPFLFKILDIEKPLSIQAHPDKKLAQVLHHNDPDNYPDRNHKPEIAICLKDMEALVGFRRPGQIFSFFRQIPELANMCSNEGLLYNDRIPPRPELLSRYQKRNWIKHHYNNLINSSKSEIEESVNSHKFRLESLDTTPKRTEDKLFLKLVELFGKKDSGVFSPYFLNYVKLNPGQALYLGPNEPHSYISGQILECMASSDNVVRAGLTKKFRDVKALIDMLHYNFGPPQIHNIASELNTRNSYRHSVPDFEVYNYILSEKSEYNIPDVQRPSIFIIMEGSLKLNITFRNDSSKTETQEFREGEIFLIPGDLMKRNISISMQNNKKGNVKCYQATVGQSYR